MPYRAVVEINAASLGGIGTNTWHARTIGGAQEGFESLGDTLETFYGSLTSVLQRPIVINFSGLWLGVGPDQGEVVESPGWTVEGTGTSAPLPPAIAQVITWRTALASRSGRGRTFLGPMAVSTLQDNGTPLETTRQTIQDAADALIAAQAGTAGEAFGVWSPTDGVLRDFARASVPNEYAVLRSRRD